MKTKIVYVVISSGNDMFLEEFWASLWSLRHYHSDAHVSVLTDQPTANRINHPSRRQLAEMITEILIIPVPEDYNGTLRSREIKTNIRNLINGDYLYIDTDTLICVDFYSFTNKLYLGELTFTPDSGRIDYYSDILQLELGSKLIIR